CLLLSNVCVVTSFYQSLQAMSSFMRFSICATYCTLSLIGQDIHALLIKEGMRNWHLHAKISIFGRVLCHPDDHIVVYSAQSSHAFLAMPHILSWQRLKIP
ncbi:hypothetical protein ACTQ3R_16605, partial [Lawsonibacter sp. LCP25S3_E2]|uniref:hypothetical protein n=1 Tax=unclassified Lawsonibacter TaxID=2617946 RepID=UPI003F95D5D7